jgi:hypothetical protein
MYPLTQSEPGERPKKDPRLMAEAYTPRVSVDCCLRDHFSLIVGLVLGLFRDHDIKGLKPLT